ncbi:hypothetical protein IMSAG192_00211 [Muribaculaceae bacterium]|nr:hypothetical protein IMSAG192_00211 [Muribaculaceae bacterium]
MYLLLAQLLASVYLVEYGVDFILGVVGCIEFLDAVVAEATPHRLEEIVALLESVHHILKLVDFHTAHLGQLLHIRAECRGILYSHGLVRTPGGEHLDFKSAVGHCLVVFERVNGIVGGAYGLHIVAAHQSAGSHRRVVLQLVVARLEYLAGGLGIEQFVDAEGCLKLKMCPVVQGIAECVRHCLGPLLKFLPVGSIGTRTETLGHTVGAHGAPLVVVSAKPYLGNRTEFMVIGHHLGYQMAVIVDNRHSGRMFMVKFLGRGGLEKKILIHERFHNICFCVRQISDLTIIRYACGLHLQPHRS